MSTKLQLVQLVALSEPRHNYQLLTCIVALALLLSASCALALAFTRAMLLETKTLL